MPKHRSPLPFAGVRFLPEVRTLLCPRREVGFAIRDEIILSMAILSFQIPLKAFSEVGPGEVGVEPGGPPSLRPFPHIREVDMVARHCVPSLSFVERNC